MPEYPLQPEQTAFVRWHWLLSLTWAGRTFRWTTWGVPTLGPDGTLIGGASGPLEIDDANGDTYVFTPGLEVEYEARVELFEDGAAEPDISIGDLLLPEDVDVALLVERGHLPTALPVELGQWFEGDAWEKVRVIARGLADVSGYDTPTEPISIEWRELLGDDESRILRPTERMTIPNWPNRAQDDAAKFYPRVYGRPGQGVDPAVFSANSTPTGAYKLLRPDTGTDELRLVAGHRVEATTLVCYADTEPVSAALTLSLVTTTDAKGQTVTTVLFPFITIEDKIWADWASSGTNGGALLRTDGTGALDGAGEIIVDLLQLTNLPIDINRWRAAAHQLDAFKLAFYIDDDSSPLEWIRNEILPVLPLSLGLGPDGIYPIIWDPSRPARASLTVGQGVERVGGVEIEESTVANEITLGYRPNGEGGDPGAYLTITGNPLLVPDDENGSNAYAAASWAAYGRKVHTLDTLVVNDAATAGLVVSWMTRAFAFPWRSVLYSADPAYGWLSLGDVVTITDPDMHWTEHRAIVRAIRWTAVELEIELLLMFDKLLDERP